MGIAEDLNIKMYHAVTDINDGIFEEVSRRLERIQDILSDAGYNKDEINNFLLDEVNIILNS